jgi:hypothetical protein
VIEITLSQDLRRIFAIVQQKIPLFEKAPSPFRSMSVVTGFLEPSIPPGGCRDLASSLAIMDRLTSSNRLQFNAIARSETMSGGAVVPPEINCSRSAAPLSITPS